VGNLVSIDNGGTFTDICLVREGRIFHGKSLTTPYDLAKCFFEVLTEGSRAIYGGEDLPRLLHETDYLRYSTTAGTNAVVQGIGPSLGLVVRRGWDVGILHLSEAERRLFADLVGDRVMEIDTLDDGLLDRSAVAAMSALGSVGAEHLVVSLDGPDGHADEARVKEVVLRRFPRHLLGATPVLYSHELVEDPDDRRRTWSALLNAFLHPTMEQFLYNAEDDLRKHRTQRPLLIYGHDGSSTRVAKTVALKTYGSGPRGGLEAAAALAEQYGLNRVLTMDIGGTTTDVARLESGLVPEIDPGDISGVPVSFRIGDVTSSGVGGSSILSVEGDAIQVGPASVGAVPGPACFARGGTEATITDAYLVMGVLDGSSYFDGGLLLDDDRAAAVIAEKIARPLGLEMDASLIALERAYDAKIAGLLTEQLEEVADVVLLAFGGAGPMSACGVAEAAGIAEVIVPKQAAVFSAFGISFSDISHSYPTTVAPATADAVIAKIAALRTRAERDMYAEGYDIAECSLEAWITPDGGPPIPVEIDGVVEAQALPRDATRLQLRVTRTIPHFALNDGPATSHVAPPAPVRLQSVLGGDLVRKDVPVFQLEELVPGTSGQGPALIEDKFFTCRVRDGWQFDITNGQDIRLRALRSES
jgi:N-methylhydantoinase A